MKTYYDITVDLYDLYPLKKIEAQQNNIGRGARITLTAGGLVLGLDGESVTMWAKKPDGTVSYLACSVVDGKIQADFTSQMLAVPGDVQVELRLVNGEENITTPIFSVHVRKSNIDDSAAESTNEFTALASMVAEVNEMKKTALKGDPGEAATLEIGTVEASEPGSAPSVTNSGTAQEAILNFILPRGQTGPEGPAGQTQIHFSAAAEFPAAGDSTMLYVDNTVSPAIIYTWTGNAYVQASADISTVMAMLATPFDPEQDYTAGQYVTYNKQYWKFTATKSAGEWDASKAVATNVGTELSAVNAKTLKQSMREWITSNEQHSINLPLNEVCLIVIANNYNAGSCWIVQTGDAAQQVVINTIFESSYFKATATGRSQITITSTSAIGFCYVWSLGIM